MAAHKKNRPRPRNRAPTYPARAPTPRNASKPAAESPTRRLLTTAGGALAASAIGSLAVRYGFHPTAVAAGMVVGGGVAAWQGGSAAAMSLGAGAMSAGGSQLALLTLAPARKAPALAASPPKQIASTEHRNASGYALPPGSLDAAFERARAQLALAHDANSTPLDATQTFDD